MRNLILILFLVFASFTFANGLKSDLSDTVNIGRENNPKAIIFEDGTGTPAKIESSAGSVSVNTDVSVSGNVSSASGTITLGDGTTKDVGISASQDGATPYLRYDSTKAAWVKSDDGIKQKKLGTGDGSGSGGINGFTADYNPDAESGVDNWTLTGTNATFIADESDPLAGDASFIFNPLDQGDQIASSVISFDQDRFRGRSCQATISYIGGDENIYWKIIDGNGKILTNNQEAKALPAHSVMGDESLWFRCPNQAEITADANKGNLQLIISQDTATNATSIKFDNLYIGTLKGLYETVLPDNMSAKFNSPASGGALISQSPNWINEATCSTSTYGVSCSFSAAFTSVPACVAQAYGTSGNINHIQMNVSLTGFNVDGRIVNGSNSGGAANNAQPFDIFCYKQNEDARQRVQVYKPIPTISEYENDFTADISTTGIVTNEYPSDWLSDVVSVSGNTFTGTYTLDLVNKMDCKFSAISSNYAWVTEVKNSSTNEQFVATTWYDYSGNGQSNTARAFSIRCKKVGEDYKRPTVSPFIIGQVLNSSAIKKETNTYINSCGFTFNGTSAPTLDSDCYFLSSSERYATGAYRFTFTDKFNFDAYPECFTQLNIDEEGTSGNYAAYLNGRFTNNLKHEFYANVGTSTTDIPATYKGIIKCTFKQ